MTDPASIVLDGGMGRELQRRNLIQVRTIWSGFALIEHPNTVCDIHSEFINAGAAVITTSNYGVVPKFLKIEGLVHRFEELTRLSVDLARQARDNCRRDVKIAGSLPPLNTSYRPDKVGSRRTLETTYHELASILAEGVDILLCETMSTAAEAQAAAVETGKPTWVAWSLDDAANGRLRSGETVTEALAALQDLTVEAFLFNCCSTEAISSALPQLRAATDRRVDAYANVFQPLPKYYEMGAEGETPLRADMSAERYAGLAQEWRDIGADIIGGCCGIGPDYIRLLKRTLH